MGLYGNIADTRDCISTLTFNKTIAETLELVRDLSALNNYEFMKCRKPLDFFSWILCLKYGNPKWFLLDLENFHILVLKYGKKKRKIIILRASWVCSRTSGASQEQPKDIVSNALFRPLVISLLQISQEGN